MEFGLCLPIFVALFFAMMEFGWYFYQHANVVHAVRASIRASVILPQEGDCIATTAATDEVKRHLRLVGYSDDELADANITQECSFSSPEETLTVFADVPYETIIGFIPAPDHITAEMSMILELQD